MLLFVQFSLTDIRRLAGYADELLTMPTWPIPNPEKDFVRGSGKVVHRRVSTQAFWPGEQYYQTLNNSILLPRVIRIKLHRSTICLIPVGKHNTIGEGGIVSKYEFAFRLTEIDPFRLISFSELDHIVKTVLDTEIKVRNMSYGYDTTTFANATKPLTGLHLLSTTSSNFLPLGQRAKLILPCIPQFYYKITSRDEIDDSIKIRILKSDPFSFRDASIMSNVEKIGACTYRKWFYFFHGNGDSYMYNSTEARALRINILRLHTEVETIKNILRSIAKKDISPDPYTNESNYLQSYLNSIITYLTKSRESLELNSIEYSKHVFNRFAPAELLNLDGKLKNLIDTINGLHLRPQIAEKTIQYIFSQTIEGDNVMGNKVSVTGSAGVVVGGNSNIQNSTISNNERKLPEAYDYAGLHNELIKLLAELQPQAKTAEEFGELAKVATAAEDAKAKNDSKLFSTLGTVGKWVTDTATKIGVSLVTDFVKHQAGI